RRQYRKVEETERRPISKGIGVQRRSEQPIYGTVVSYGITPSYGRTCWSRRRRNGAECERICERCDTERRKAQKDNKAEDDVPGLHARLLTIPGRPCPPRTILGVKMRETGSRLSRKEANCL